MQTDTSALKMSTREKFLSAAREPGKKKKKHKHLDAAAANFARQTLKNAKEGPRELRGKV